MRYRFALVALAFVGLAAPIQAQVNPKFVFIANGAGGGTTVSDNMADLAGEMNLPLRFHTIFWCRGDHAIADYKDHVAQWTASYRLAEMALRVRRDCPKAEIYFVGNSTGTAIVTRAAEMLPRDSIDRIILIAAPISPTYDLRPALRASRAGIDNFWSPDDDLLDRVTPDWGNLDGVKGPAAGRVGFWYPRWTDAEGFGAYKNVRQYRWCPGMPGNGGHFTWTVRTENMRCYMMPLFVTSDK
jgi:pimeloyl-ACP methyl ester carboxylesterase